MRESGLKDYYEQELRYLREMGREFAEQHEEVAEGLRMESGAWTDPHVERLLDGFAFLAARIHRRLDDDFSEISEALLNIVYPHFLRPIPSLSIVQMELDPDQGMSSGFRVENGQSLVSPPTKEGGVRCRFRTCYPVELWPIHVADATWRSPHGLNLGIKAKQIAACLSLRLDCDGEFAFSDLEIDRLRFFLHGDFSLTSTLFELLDNNCTEIIIREADGKSGSEWSLPGSALRPVGLEPDEGTLPLPRPSFLGYSVVREYFAFPSKFLFLDLSGLASLHAREMGKAIEILFLFRSFAGSERQESLERGITKDTFRLGCTPVVNLFETESEPIRVTHRRAEYLLRARGATKDFSPEVFSIDAVEAVTGDSPTRTPLKPFFSYQHRDGGKRSSVFWYSRRFPSSWLDDGATDVSISFVDPVGDVLYPNFPTIAAKITCFNGSLPSRLPIGTDRDFQTEDGGGSALRKITSLLHPTEPIQPPLASATFWQIVSQFSLNYLSLAEDGGKALRELLRLHNIGASDSGEKHIRGITQVERKPHFARFRGEQGLSFARGSRVTIEFDEDHFSNGGIYLLATILDRFLGLYTNINSFSQLVARVKSKGKTYTLREWQPRAGQKALL